MRRVPTQTDVASLEPDLIVARHAPFPPAATTALLLLFHGFGDAETSFLAFARALRLPGVAALAIRGPSVVPPLLVADDDDLVPGDGPQNFHWGDDLKLDPAATDLDPVLDPDPGFDRAVRLVHTRLIQDLLVARCGWRTDDLLLFGYGQGASFALALAARSSHTYRGLLAIAPPHDLPSAVTMGAPSTAPPLATPLLVCGPTEGSADVSASAAALRRRFAAVTVVPWSRTPADDIAMPRNRAEMLPIMTFFADRLRA